jgi:hypothetical protein
VKQVSAREHLQILTKEPELVGENRMWVTEDRIWLCIKHIQRAKCTLFSSQINISFQIGSIISVLSLHVEELHPIKDTSHFNGNVNISALMNT